MSLLADSQVFIGAERDAGVLDWLHGQPEEICASVVTVTECLHGVERDVSATRQQRRRSFFEQVFASITLVPVDVGVAEEAGRLLAELSRAGTPIPALDVLIAATARHHAWPLATADRHFERVEGLRLLLLLLPPD